MTTVRCYVPLAPDQLARLHLDRRLVGPRPGYAVTGAVREAHPAGDQDEWEYTALQEAALALRTKSAPVLVAAVDLTTDQVDATSPDGARVRVGDIDLPRVAALHLGDDVITGGGATPDDQDEQIELSWYDTTEIAHVVELARACAPGDPPGRHHPD